VVAETKTEGSRHEENTHERVERVLATYVYLWDHESHPTEMVVEELRRLVASSGLSGDDEPELPKDAEQLAEVVRHLPAVSGVLRGPTFPTPILSAVLASPPQDWTLELLRRLSWVDWQMYQLNDAPRSMDHWLQATTTVADHNLEVAKENYTSSAGSFRKQARGALTRVRGVLPLLDH